jgi:hypothetical protein
MTAPDAERQRWLRIVDREPEGAIVSAGVADPPTLADKALLLCYAIEALPASEQQTQCSVLASELRAALAPSQPEAAR